MARGLSDSLVQTHSMHLGNFPDGPVGISGDSSQAQNSYLSVRSNVAGGPVTQFCLILSIPESFISETGLHSCRQVST